MTKTKPLFWPNKRSCRYHSTPLSAGYLAKRTDVKKEMHINYWGKSKPKGKETPENREIFQHVESDIRGRHIFCTPMCCSSEGELPFHKTRNFQTVPYIHHWLSQHGIFSVMHTLKIPHSVKDNNLTFRNGETAIARRPERTPAVGKNLCCSFYTPWIYAMSSLDG